MHPAPSVIIFSVFSGMGFGLLAMLGFGFAQAYGWPAFFWWGLGYGLAIVGLLAATFHLGNPKNALKSFSQWRTSWLSREAWGAVTALLLLAKVFLILLGIILIAQWKIGDGQFARAGQSMGTATGLQGEISVFEQGHTAGNYLLREMIFVVGRKHAQKLRAIAIGLAVVLPLLILTALPNAWGFGLAAVSHVIGAFAQRWLFFAEAEHVVGLFYGKR